MIIEFFGLSNSGKSVLKKQIESQGYPILKFEQKNTFLKFFLFIKNFFLHPTRNSYLFYKLNTSFLSVSLIDKIKSLPMRNSYLVSLFAKEEYLKKYSKVYTDEYFLQGVFMILNKKSSKKEIEKLLDLLPKSDIILLFEGNKDLRKKAYEKKHPYRKGTLLPGSQISMNYGIKWMDSMEHNFELVKEFLLNYKRLPNFDNLKASMEKINKDFIVKNKTNFKFHPIQIFKLR